MMFKVLGNILIQMIADAIGDSDPDLLNLWKSSLTAVMGIVVEACC